MHRTLVMLQSSQMGQKVVLLEGGGRDSAVLPGLSASTLLAVEQSFKQRCFGSSLSVSIIDCGNFRKIFCLGPSAETQ